MTTCEPNPERDAQNSCRDDDRCSSETSRGWGNSGQLEASLNCAERRWVTTVDLDLLRSILKCGAERQRSCSPRRRRVVGVRTVPGWWRWQIDGRRSTRRNVAQILMQIFGLRRKRHRVD